MPQKTNNNSIVNKLIARKELKWLTAGARHFKWLSHVLVLVFQQLISPH